MTNTAIYEKIATAAARYLRGRRVAELIPGTSLTFAGLDSGEIGCSCSLGQSSGVLPLHTEGAEEAAQVFIESGDLSLRAAALAVINAAGAAYWKDRHLPPELPLQDACPLRPEDRLGMVGYIRPVAEQARSVVQDLFIFDDSLPEETLPREDQARILPQCSCVYITGSTLVNRSLHEVLGFSKNAREIALVGPSACLLPDAYAGSGITILAGCIWKQETAALLAQKIREGAGMREVTSLNLNTRITLRLHPPAHP